MKNNLLQYLLLILIFSACETPDSPKEIDLLKIDVPNNYFGSQYNDMTRAQVFLTNEQGNLVANDELSNNLTTVLKSDFDIQSSQLAFTYLLKLEHNNGTSYKAFTFNNVDLLDLKFTEPSAQNVISEKAYIKIINTNGKVNTLPFDFYRFFDETIIYMDSTVFQVDLERIPQDLYFKVQHEEEEFQRYIMLNNVEPNSTTTIQFNDLPQLTNSKTFTFPDSEFVRTSIYGAGENNPDDFYAKLVDFYSYDGVTSQEVAFPDNLFNKFNVYRTLRKNGVSYHKSAIETSFDLNFSLPDMSFEIMENNIDNYRVNTTGNFDFFSTAFTYYTENVDFTWYFYSEGNNEINFQFPDLEKEFKNEIPELSFDLLTNTGAGIYKFEGLNSYKEFILSKLDLNYEYTLYKTESVSKSLN